VGCVWNLYVGRIEHRIDVVVDSAIRRHRTCGRFDIRTDCERVVNPFFVLYCLVLVYSSKTRKRPGFFLLNIDMLKNFFQKKFWKQKTRVYLPTQNTTKHQNHGKQNFEKFNVGPLRSGRTFKRLSILGGHANRIKQQRNHHHPI
jgi:hypothetical protein